MKLLLKKQTMSARMPKVRESQRVINALAREAKIAGIPVSEALRQLVEAHLTNKAASLAEDVEDGGKGGHWAPVQVLPATLAALGRDAGKRGISVAELVRRIVHKHLASTKSH